MNRTDALRLGAAFGFLLALTPAMSDAQTRQPAQGDSAIASAVTAAAAALAAPSAAATATVVAGSQGFQLRSTDGAFALRVRGGAQYDGRIFLGDGRDATIDQFVLRRVRSDLQGTLYRDYDFRFHLDFVGSRVELLDAYINARFTPALQLRAGKMKGPVGLERLQTPFTMPFAERALPTSLVPNRDIGVQLHGTLLGSRVDYAFGVFNGVADGSSAEGDDADSKDVNARVIVMPFRQLRVRPLAGLSVGLAGTYGRQAGTAAAPGLAQLRSGSRELFFRYRADNTDAGTTVLDGARTRIVPQGSWYYGSVGAAGEYVRVTHAMRRGNEARALTNKAWQATLSWAVTGEAASSQGITPHRPFNAATGDWGAWEIALRANALTIDQASFPVFADPARNVQAATAYAGGINWYLNRAVRLQFNYEVTSFDAAPGGAARPNEQVLISRMQVAF
jgi:phosphate-selective porin OprO/OprP